MREKINKKPEKIAFPPVYHIDRREIAAVVAVLKKGPLSGFVGEVGQWFFGGPVVRRFERAFARKFRVKHAVSYNSATTALHGAVAALGVGPGDEVIVPPYTMSASATAVLMNGAVPIFSDINEDNYCLDPESVRKKISKRTKAIIVVNLFGGPAELYKILNIARKHKLKV